MGSTIEKARGLLLYNMQSGERHVIKFERFSEVYISENLYNGNSGIARGENMDELIPLCIRSQRDVYRILRGVHILGYAEDPALEAWQTYLSSALSFEGLKAIATNLL